VPSDTVNAPDPPTESVIVPAHTICGADGVGSAMGIAGVDS
jgi:hypothetical protein